MRLFFLVFGIKKKKAAPEIQQQTAAEDSVAPRRDKFFRCKWYKNTVTLRIEFKRPYIICPLLMYNYSSGGARLRLCTAVPPRLQSAVLQSNSSCGSALAGWENETALQFRRRARWGIFEGPSQVLDNPISLMSLLFTSLSSAVRTAFVGPRF